MKSFLSLSIYKNIKTDGIFRPEDKPYVVMNIQHQ
jgi:hypothetical protein